MEFEHELIICIVDEGFADNVMEAAKECGARGGTVIHAKGTANKELLTLMGLASTDRAVIFSVVREDKIPKLLASLEHKFKTIKNGKGIAYTVPLSSLIGVSAFAFLCNNRKLLEESKHE